MRLDGSEISSSHKLNIAAPAANIATVVDRHGVHPKGVNSRLARISFLSEAITRIVRIGACQRL